MNSIKHISFDVWNTLIKPNPNFASARKEMLARISGHTEAEVQQAYTDTKHHADEVSIRQGHGVTTDDVFKVFLFKLLGTSTPGMIMDHRYAVEALFHAYPPIIEQSVRDLMHRLRLNGISVSIASNSNFISGNMMWPFLQRQFGGFEFGVFSDIERVSKPSMKFFMHVLQGVAELDITGGETLHVGDNLICDIEGASRLGMQTSFVRSPDDLYVAVNSRLNLK